MPNFRFYIQQLESSDADMITHDLSELIVISRGQGSYVTEAGKIPVRAGNVLVTSGNITHRIENENNLNYFSLMFDPAQFIEPDKDMNSLPGFHALFVLEPLFQQHGELPPALELTPETLATTLQLIQQMRDEFSRRTPGFQAIIMAYFTQLVVYLSRQYVASESPESLWRLAKVLAHIEIHYREPITLEELAAMGNMSINHFLRTFKKLFTLSPIEYVIRLRLRKACTLMQQTDYAINQIADEVGFSDGNYFARQFRKVTGKTPREFRKELQAVAML